MPNLLDHWADAVATATDGTRIYPTLDERRDVARQMVACTAVRGADHVAWDRLEANFLRVRDATIAIAWATTKHAA